MRLAKKILLVGWDSADWGVIHPLLDRGELPSLQQLIESGVSGNLASMRPMLSPMLWTSIATGQRPHKHGVHGFTEIDSTTHQMLPVSSASRRVAALWEILGQSGLRSNVVSWFATHPAEAIDGACVSDLFAIFDPSSTKAPAHSVYPSELEQKLSDLRVRLEDIDGSLLRLFIADLAEIDPARDNRPATLARYLVECFSTHAAATWLLEHQPADFTAVYYRAIDWVSHDFMAYHPPRMDGIRAKDAARYGDVVNSIYRLHDRLLGRLIQLAGPETTVVLVSDHGFFHNHLRPKQTAGVTAGIAAWHRPIGILAMAGSHLRRDELIHGASLLDIAPTILAMFDLPVGRDMDGRVLNEAFTEPKRIEFIDTWQNMQPRSRPVLDAEGAHKLRQHFAELGYIKAATDPMAAEVECERENNWNLACALIEAGLHQKALPLLEEIYHAWPERTDFGLQLANCQLHLGLDEEARATMQTVLEPEGDTPLALLIRGNIEYRRRNFAASLQLLREAEAADPQLTGLYNQIGYALLKLARWSEAEETFRKGLALDVDDPQAHLGIAYSLVRRRRFAEAVEWSLAALGRNFHLPLAHFTLGLALARLEENDRAIQAFETCLRFAPGYAPAHRFLALLYSRRGDGQQLVRLHRDQSSKSELRLAHEEERKEQIRREAAERARLREEAKRSRRAAEVNESLAPNETKLDAPLEFLIVSGLPRSGTSLMMQILGAAGLPLMTDDCRPADESNPRGYYEWQEIKQLPQNPALIEKTHGRVTKIISMLLPSLPQRHRYRIIFMRRDLAAVAVSQEKMRRRLSTPSGINAEELRTHLTEHRDRILEMLRAHPNIGLLEICYEDLLGNPTKIIAEIARFVGVSSDREGAMAAVIEPSLSHAPACAG